MNISLLKHCQFIKNKKPSWYKTSKTVWSKKQPLQSFFKHATSSFTSWKSKLKRNIDHIVTETDAEKFHFLEDQYDWSKHSRSSP